MSRSCTTGDTITLPADQLKELDDYIDGFNIKRNDSRKKGHLIQVLHKAQSIFGYLPEPLQLHVADKLFLHHADVSGVISFYNFFTTQPKGNTSISVCMGTACYVKGADKVLAEFEKELGIKAGEVTEDLSYSIDALRCVGACGLAPVVTINEKVYGRVKPSEVKTILAKYRPESEEQHG